MKWYFMSCQNTTLRCGNCSQFGMDYQLPVSHNHPLLSPSLESAVMNNLHRTLQDEPAGVEGRQNLPPVSLGIYFRCMLRMYGVNRGRKKTWCCFFLFFSNVCCSIYLNCSLFSSCIMSEGVKLAELVDLAREARRANYLHLCWLIWA